MKDLASEINRPGDVNSDAGANGQTLVIPNPTCGSTEDDFIDDIFDADRSYPDNLEYDLYPETILPVFDDPGYNSNSYTSGILGSVGANTPAPPASVPGWSTPVPPQFFQP